MASAGVVGGKKGVRVSVIVNDGVGNRVSAEINVGVTLALTTTADGDKAGALAFSLQLIRRGNAKRIAKILIFMAALSFISLNSISFILKFSVI